MSESDGPQFDRADVLTRIVAPFGAAMIAVSQLSGGADAWIPIAVMVVGLLVGFNQVIEALDRRLNRNLYERDSDE